MTTSNPSESNPSDDALRNLVATSGILPAISDEEIEAAFADAVAKNSLSDEQLRRVLGKVNRLIATSATKPAARHDEPSASSVPLVSSDSKHVRTVSTVRTVGSVGTVSDEPRLVITSPAMSAPRIVSRSAMMALTASLLSLIGVCVLTSREPMPNRSIVEQRSTTIMPRLADRLRRQAGSYRLTAKPAPKISDVPKVASGDTIQTGDFERRRLALPDDSILYVNANTNVTVRSNRSIDVTRGSIFVEVAQRSDAAKFEVITPGRTVTSLGTKFAVKVDDADTAVMVTQGRVRVAGVREAISAGQKLIVSSGFSTQSGGRLPIPRDSAQNAAGNSVDKGYVVTAVPSAVTELDWTRDLIAAATGPLVPKSEYAGGALVTVDPNGQSSQLSLRKYHVDVHIEDGFAQTTIDQTYFNHTHSRLEGTFYFPLPPDASLSRLAMYVNGKLMEGGMAERDHARNTFEEIKRKMLDPALLEWVDGSTFKMRVFPLEPRQEKRIILSYSQRLPSNDGQMTYRFPAGHTMDVVREWSASARIKGADGSTWHSPSHDLKPVDSTAREDAGDLLLEASMKNAMLDRDLVIQFADNTNLKSQISNFQSEAQQYLMLRLRPDLTGDMERKPHHWVFLFEHSGDRTPLLARAQIEILRTLLNNAEHSDTFSIVKASTRATLYSEQPLECSPENIDAAVKHLENVHLVGAMDLTAALQAATQASGKASALAARVPDTSQNTSTVFVHLGSGHTALGERDAAKLVELLPKDVPYIGIGIGKRWNQSLMNLAASHTGGLSVQINPDEDIAWRALEVFSKMHSPRLVHVKLQTAPAVANDVRSESPVAPAAAGIAHGGLTPSRSPGPSQAEPPFHVFSDTICQGEELAAICRVPEGQPLPTEIIVTATLNGQPWSQTIAVENIKDEASYLPRHWARLEIDRLLAENAAANREAIVALSKSMYVMSPFTSLLVLENDEMYTQFNVDRGRKDHWAMYACPEQISVVVENGDATHPTDSKIDGEIATIGSNETDVMSTIVRIPEMSWPVFNYVDDGIDGFGRQPQYWGKPTYWSFQQDNLRFDHFATDDLGVVSNRYIQGDSGFPPTAQYPYYTVPGAAEFFGTQNIDTSNRWRLPRFDGYLSWDLDNERDGIQDGIWLEPQIPALPGEDVRDRIVIPGFTPPPRIALFELQQAGATSGAFLARSNTGLGEDQFASFMRSRLSNRARFPFIPSEPDSWGDFLNFEDPAVNLRSSGNVELVDELGLIILKGNESDVRLVEKTLAEQERARGLFQLNSVELSTIVDGTYLVDTRSWAELTRVRERRRIQEQMLPPLERQTVAQLSNKSSIHLHDAEFQSVIQQLSTSSGVNIAIDVPALQRAGIAEKQLVSIDVDGITLKSALNLLLDQVGDLTYRITGDVVTIRPTLQREQNGGPGLPSFVNTQTHRWSAAQTSDGASLISLPVFNSNGQLPAMVNPMIFTDLMSHAPGLNTSTADTFAVVEAEASLSNLKSEISNPSAGRVDEAARELIEKARGRGWESVTIGGSNHEPGITIHYDGQGRHVWERMVSEGLREHVVCDGSTLWHVYRDIGLASKRPFSRFHHRDFSRLVPWLLPSANELARDADVIAIDERTVAIVPVTLQSEISNSKSQRSQLRLHLIFDSEARLIERQLMERSEKDGTVINTILQRTVYSADGVVKVLDRDNKELLSINLHRAIAAEPKLTPDLIGLVVLPMPVRTPEVILERANPVARSTDSPSQADQTTTQNADLGQVGLRDFSENDAIALMLAYMAKGNGPKMIEVARERFIDKGDTRDGLSVLLSRFPSLLVQTEAPNVAGYDLRPSVEGSPLKQFVRQSITWIRETSPWQPGAGSVLEFRVDAPEGSFLQRMAMARNLSVRWQTDAATRDLTQAQVQQEVDQTLQFVSKCRNLKLGWLILNTMKPRLTTPEHKTMFAKAAERFETLPQIGLLVRRDRILALFAAGQHQEARELFAEWFSEHFKLGTMPVLGNDLYKAFVAGPNGEAAFSELMKSRAEKLIASQQLMSVNLLAIQISQLGNPPLADQLMTMLIEQLRVEQQPEVSLLAIEQLRRLNDPRAATLLDRMLDLPSVSDFPQIWRFASQVAESSGHKRLSIDRLELAMQLEFATRPTTINIETVRADYSGLLAKYEELIDAAATLETTAPEGLVDRIIQAVDQWRSLDDDDTAACQTASRLLGRLKSTDLAWAYATTPLAENSGESEPWIRLAKTQTETNQFALAERAWNRAFEFESTNPDILLQHAKMQLAAGQTATGKTLLQQIGSNTWQPRFSSTVHEAKQLLQSL